ncbi:efflux RND transporter periplasmic adaptor subunit [Neptunicella marina]|uniref:Efflux RND transporter periplasmic adaptor subunit n=1 Tax=Neptunicella marina TaxID=2125989 RepID=A0A8J6IRZ8_9ALTE|nr:efflux RND transporter periplasmic adaptor subunit [Neptunicella marina]MBC3765194.1 efflux RND transporter periplasmic adaptor subunit [Neptunicella marina]
MKKTLIKPLVVAVIVIGAIYWWMQSSGTTEQAIKYHTQPVTRGNIESTVNTAGTISPVVTVDVGSELSGLISQLNVDFNDEVTSGQVIARIDDRTVQSRLKQSEADLASAKASLAQLQAALTKAKTEEALAEREFKRTKELRDKNLISASELDISETQYELAKVSIDTAKAAIIAGEARVMQSQSSLEQVKLDLDRTFIRSPVNGVIIDRQVDKGQAVSASLSAPTLFSIAQDLVKMQIEADVDEADIGRIKQDQPVRFSVDAFPNRKFDGVVSQVRKAATVTNNVVTYKVIISLENKDLSLLPGMTANVDIILGQRNDVLRVANSALRFSPPESATNNDAQQSMDDRAAEMARQLGLNSDQQKKLEAVMQKMQAQMREMRDNRSSMPGPPGNIREQMQKLRAQNEGELRSFLTPEQMEKYQAMQNQRRSSFAKTRGQGMQRGTVWVLRDGEPHKVNVRVGISDTENSEIVSEQLQAGDNVIVRAQRISQ